MLVDCCSQCWPSASWVLFADISEIDLSMIHRHWKKEMKRGRIVIGKIIFSIGPLECLSTTKFIAIAYVKYSPRVLFLSCAHFTLSAGIRPFLWSQFPWIFFVMPGQTAPLHFTPVWGSLNRRLWSTLFFPIFLSSLSLFEYHYNYKYSHKRCLEKLFPLSLKCNACRMCL